MTTSDTKRVFVAATMQDQGKTTVSLGLMAAFGELMPPVGFIKPVGQRYVEIGDHRVDEDVALMRAVFPGAGELEDMSPVTVGRTFTRNYIVNPQPTEIMRKIVESFGRIAHGRNLVVIEGTGHAGVGSCFDASNADVANVLRAKAILIAGGGVGKPIDEVMLNENLFRTRGVELVGVILNKVLPGKLDEIREIVGKGLSRKGIELLGCVPYEPMLANPSMRQILEEIGGRLLHGEGAMDLPIRSTIVGAMTAHRALEYIEPGCLLITPGDRDDMVLAAMSTVTEGPENSVAGILLTGGVHPHPSILRLIKRSQVPVILHDDDSYSVAAAVNALKVKIQPADKEKIAAAPRLVSEHVDIPKILERM